MIGIDSPPPVIGGTAKRQHIDEPPAGTPWHRVKHAPRQVNLNLIQASSADMLPFTPGSILANTTHVLTDYEALFLNTYHGLYPPFEETLA